MGVIQTSVASLIMPSVITKPQENGAPQVQETSIQAAIAIVEKKVRNLEKRKGKLDSYRDILKRGKALNEDQQSAVDKYDEVISTLEFTRELMGQFGKLAQDEARDKKKLAKKEQIERSKEELSKVTYILAVKEVLSSLQEEGVLADLKAGSDGAPKLSPDQLTQLKQHDQLVSPDREMKEKGSFDKQVNQAAEHLVNLTEKKSRTVAGSTYQDLNILINTIRESGYIESRWARDSATNTEADIAAEADYDTQDTQEDDEDETMPATEPINNDKMEVTNGHAYTKDSMLGHNHSDTPDEAPMPVFPSPPQEQQKPQMTQENHLQQQQQQPPQPQRQPQQPAAPEPAPISFFQDSEIDLESPHMDPAGVMVHPAKRLPGHPAPGLQAGYVDHNRLMMENLHIHQQQQHQQMLAAQQQQSVAISAADSKFSSSHNSFDAPLKAAGPGQVPGMANGLPGSQTGAPLTQTSPAENRQGPATDPRAPRVPDGTPQHPDPSPNKAPVYNPSPSQPSGYAAAAGGSNNIRQPDTEIGTWRPEGAVNGDDEEEGEGRHGGDKGRRGRGGRGYGGGRGNNSGRGYSRGRGGGGDRDRGGYRGGRGGERRQYDDRRDDRPRGSGGRSGGGYRGRGGPRGGGQNGYRD